MLLLAGGFFIVDIHVSPCDNVFSEEGEIGMSQKVWVLTSEYNSYDQEGECFEAVFIKKPTVEQLVEYFYKSDSKVPNFTDPMKALGFVLHVQNGGGREGSEHVWFNLNEVEAL